MTSVEKRQGTEQRESATGTAAAPWWEALSCVLSWSRKAEAIMSEKKGNLTQTSGAKFLLFKDPVIFFITSQV